MASFGKNNNLITKKIDCSSSWVVQDGVQITRFLPHPLASLPSLPSQVPRRSTWSQRHGSQYWQTMLWGGISLCIFVFPFCLNTQWWCLHKFRTYWTLAHVSQLTWFNLYAIFHAQLPFGELHVIYFLWTSQFLRWHACSWCAPHFLILLE